MIHFCPSCGFNLIADKPLVIGDWELSLGWAKLRGEQLALPPAMAKFIYAIGACKGGTVSYDAMLARITETDNINMMHVYATRLRKMLKADCSIQTVRGMGYRWKGAV
jgi:DNA-binding response OmpR family regulator